MPGVGIVVDRFTGEVVELDEGETIPDGCYLRVSCETHGRRTVRRGPGFRRGLRRRRGAAVATIAAAAEAARRTW